MAGKGDNLLCEKDVARMLNISVRTVQRGRMDGDGPKWLKIRGAVRYRQMDITDYVIRNMRAAEKMVAA